MTCVTVKTHPTKDTTVTKKTSDKNIDAPTRFCMSPRFILFSWGYCKIIIDFILMLPITTGPLPDVFGLIYDYAQFLRMLIVILLMALTITDIVFHSKLVHGLRKKNVVHLSAYCKYTRVLWILILLTIAIFFTRPYQRRYMDDRLLTCITIISIATIFQTLIMLLVIKEIKNLNGENDHATTKKNRLFSIGFTVKIETSRTKKVEENVNIENNTCEKAQLAV